MSILLQHLTKRYSNHSVVNNLTLEVEDGEFFVLLGPSGSGKSTVLRMIAGLTGIDTGRVLLHGRDVTHVAPQQREIGFVFQNYALFRHMNVGDNIEFALRVRHVPAVERRRRRDELLEMVGLAGLASRMPHQLSGGQQQRVALARALAHQPAVLLLDEPFGALDAKIRTELRRTLKQVQREIGMSTIFVTHDQDEAFELADRLGVMNAGRLLEVGRPEELYQHPQTEFVATFLGTANVLVGTCTADAVQIGPLRLPLSSAVVSNSSPRPVQVLFRPEDIALGPSAEALRGSPLGQAEVERTTFVGSFERLRLRLPPLPGVRPVAPPVPFGRDMLLLEATRTLDQARQFPLQAGEQVWVGVRRMHALAHPGMRFLMLTDGSAEARSAVQLGGRLAHLAHARVSILGYGAPPAMLDRHFAALKEELAGGLPAFTAEQIQEPLARAVAHKAEREAYDLLIVNAGPQTPLDRIEQLLGVGSHHLLLVPGLCAAIEQILICVASGEPAKEDVLFAGRLARHLGARATLMSVLPNDLRPDMRERFTRFLAAGTRTLALLGVPAVTSIRTGDVQTEIRVEMAEGNYDLLVLGAPLKARDGHLALTGVVEALIRSSPSYPILIVRSNYVASGPHVAVNGRAMSIEEIIR